MALAIERCMHIATAHEIGEWVTKTATTVLAERAQKIAEIESRSSEEPAAPVPMPAPARAPMESVSSELATKRDNAVITATEPAPKEETTENSSGTRFTQTSTIQQSGSDEVPSPPSGSRRRTASIVALMACAALATIFLRRTPPSAPPNVAEAPAPPAAPAAAPPTPAAPPEVTGIAVTDLPIAAAAPEPSTSSSAAHANGKRLRPPPPSPKPPGCNPPYTLDENHIRRIKPQCL